MNPFRLGSGLLIKELDAHVIPMRLDGLWKLKQANRHFARPGEVSVNVGHAVRYSNQDTPEQISRDLAQRVKAA
jgi:1-acyl-sn-glycerol-3-phosphate acyltransferase